MSNNVFQTSFSAGELSPTLLARTDIAKYHVGAALLENFFVDYRGGASTRPGTAYIDRTKSTDTVVLIPFQFSTVQTYVLEFGPLYMRVIKDGAQVLEVSETITNITQAAEAIVTSAAHGYANGDWVFIDSVLGMAEVNKKFFIVDAATTNTFGLLDLDGNAVDSRAFFAYAGGGTVARVFTLTTPYAAADLRFLKYVQSADVMTIVHPAYPAKNLTRSGHAAWTLTDITFASNIAAPTGLVGTPSAVGDASFAYVVTAVGADNQESVASARADVINSVAIMSTAGSIALSWAAVAGADHYNVYKANPTSAPAGTPIPTGANYGFMGSFTGTSAVDTNITPDFTKTPPLHTNPFASGNNPGAVGYFQQRQVFGGSTSQPETLWMSQTGHFANFDESNPVKGDDSITATLSSLQVNNIKYMVAMPNGLIVLTGGGAWQLSGGSQNSAITPSSIAATPQAYNGTADIQPIVINYDILYVQAKGTVVRDMTYNFFTNIYTGVDISLLSNQLFHSFTLLQWAYAEEPFKIVWAVRDDGVLLSLTFLKEQEITGWAHHETQGLFQSVATIQEGNENAVYLVVKRYLNGKWVQLLERMAARTFTYGAEDAWCLDCALQNVLPAPAANLSASAATGAVIFTADAAVFHSGDVGSVLRMGGGIAKITGFTSTIVVQGTLLRDIQDVIPQSGLPLEAAQGEWSLTAPFTTVTGLEHLEGETVVPFGDGNVFPQQQVINGSITLPDAVTKLVVGLDYRARLQTLPLDVGEPTIQGKRKKITAMTMRVTEARGLSAGPDFDHLTEYKQRTTEAMGQPIELFTGDQRLLISPIWQEPGQVAIEVTDPVPATVLGIIYEVVVGDTK